MATKLFHKGKNVKKEEEIEPEEHRRAMQRPSSDVFPNAKPETPKIQKGGPEDYSGLKQR